MKKTLCILFAAVVLGLVAVQIFDRFLDSESTFWKAAVVRSDAWAEQLDARYPAKYVAAGGSSTRTSIDPALLLEEQNIPLVNAALHAGFGMAIHLEGALPYLRSGDTLILSLEPLLLATTSSAMDSHGTNGDKFFVSQLAAGAPHTELASWSKEDVARILRGNSYQIVVRSIRHLIGAKPYRYTQEDLHPSGWLEVKHSDRLHPGHYSVEQAFRTGMPTAWSMGFLKRIAEWGEKHGVRVIYAIPRAYLPEEARIFHAALALRLMEVMPVLRDRSLGVDTEASHFSDTANHANELGTQLTTREWGRALSQQDFWSQQELRDYIHARGWNENGTPRPLPRTGEAR